MKSTENSDANVAAIKLGLAVSNVRRLLHINQTDTSLDEIAGSLQRNMIDAHGNDPSDLCDMMTLQAQILDSLFHRYVDQGIKPTYLNDSDLAFAFKAQSLMLRTAHAWKRMKAETEIIPKVVHFMVPEKNTDGTN